MSSFLMASLMMSRSSGLYSTHSKALIAFSEDFEEVTMRFIHGEYVSFNSK